MRREIIVLVAGLAAVAALPVQESASSTQQDDLLQAILTVNPEENDIFPDDGNKLPASQTKDGKEALTKEMVEEQLQQHSQLEDPLKEQVQVQNPPEEQKETSPHDHAKEQDELQLQDSSHEQKQTPSQDPSEEKEEAEPQSLPQKVTQPQLQVHEMELYFPDVREAVSPADELSRSEPQLIRVDTKEALPLVLEDLEGDKATSFDSEIEGHPIEPNDDYVVIHVKEETPFRNMGGEFTYGRLEEKTSLDQEAGPVLYIPEKFPPKPQMDFILSESEPPKEPFSVKLQPQRDPISYDYEVPLGREEESFSLEPQTESDYEQMPWDIKEKPGDEYDYEFPAETYQPNLEEPESVPSDDSYYSDRGESADTLSWHAPDFFDEEPTNYDESFYDSGYYDQVPTIEDQPQNMHETMFEQQVPYTGNGEEPSVSEVSDPSDFLDGSLLRGEGDVVVIEEVPLDMTDSGKRTTEDISLVGYFIPDHTYGGSQEYSNVTPEDEVEEFVFPDEEAFLVDDSSTEGEPLLETDLNELETLSENSPSEDSRYIAQWSVEGDRGDQRVIPEEDETITILETQPLHIPDMQTDMSYPVILKEVLEENAAEEGQNKPWSYSKPLMMEFTPEADTLVDTSLPEERDYLSEAPDDDAMEIIMIKGPRENFDNFPATPIVYDSPNTRGRQPLMAWYPENGRQQYYWMPHRNSNAPDPKMYYSFSDESQRRKFPRAFESMYDQTVSSYISGPPRETAANGNPFSIINDIHDEMPPQYFAAPSTTSRYEFKSLDFPFSNRNDPNMLTTPRLSFRDLLQSLNPSYYNNMYVEDNHRQVPSLYSSHSYNPFLRYNGLSRQNSYTIPFQPYYSSPINSIKNNDYLLEENYHPSKLDFSSYDTNNMPPSIYREDTMPGVYSRGPKRHYEDYANDHPFFSSYSYSLPSSPPLSFERQQYDDNFPSFNSPQYSQNSYYSTGPYHPKPIYTRYAPMHYGM